MAKLTARARKAIPTSKFAGPGRTYPIEDKGHAKDALARSSGKPIAGRIRAEVKKDYPNMKVKGFSSKQRTGKLRHRTGA